MPDHLRDESDGFSDEDEAIERVRNLFPSSVASVQVSRYHPGKGREYLGQIPVYDFSLDRVRDLFGGGRYHFQIRDSQGQYRGAGTASIAGATKTRP